MTIKELLTELDANGTTYTKIESGYFVGKMDTDILCKCDGNNKALTNDCQRCGRISLVCEACLERHDVYACNRCDYDLTQVFRKLREEGNARIAENLGLSIEDFKDYLQRIKERSENEKGSDDEQSKQAV